MSEPGAAARAAAWRGLRRLGGDGSGLEDLLASDDHARRLDARDRAFALALGRATCRGGARLDAVHAPFVNTRPDDAVREMLRLISAQKLILDLPAHAVLSASIDAAKAEPELRRASGFINAVGRKLLADEAAPARFAAAPADGVLPRAVKDRWTDAYGAPHVMKIARAIAERPRVFVHPRDGDMATLIARTGGEAALGAVRLPEGTPVETAPGFGAGLWWVQDPAAALPASLLKARAGDHVLDLCAAPGGKAMQSAASGAAVTAVDIDAARLETTRANFARTGLNADMVEADIRTWRPDRPFNRVLLDAPCSATGLARRRPDLLRARTTAHIAAMANLQRDLLEAAADMTAPGGVLVFATCSLETEEGEDQARAFLENRRDFICEPIMAAELGAFRRAVRQEGWARVTPDLGLGEGGGDGFFIARFRRAGP